MGRRSSTTSPRRRSSRARPSWTHNLCPPPSGPRLRRHVDQLADSPPHLPSPGPCAIAAGRSARLCVKFADFQMITRSRSRVAPISDRSTLSSISAELLAAQFPMRAESPHRRVALFTVRAAIWRRHSLAPRRSVAVHECCWIGTLSGCQSALEGDPFDRRILVVALAPLAFARLLLAKSSRSMCCHRRVQRVVGLFAVGAYCRESLSEE